MRLKPSTDQTNKGCRALAVAVLELALEDARGAPVPHDNPRRLTHDQSAARHFLTAASGSWKRARAAWCDRAGIDPDAFDRYVQKVLG